MELHEGEELIWRGRPSVRSSVTFFLRWGFIAILPALITGILQLNDRGTGFDWSTWLVISLVLLVVVVIVDLLRRASSDYVVTTERIRIRRGILSRREQSTMIARVQNINTSQRLLERLLHIGAVDFDTAGTEAAEASFRFEGIAEPHDLVHRLEAHLTELRRGAAAG